MYLYPKEFCKIRFDNRTLDLFLRPERKNVAIENISTMISDNITSENFYCEYDIKCLAVFAMFLHDLFEKLDNNVCKHYKFEKNIKKISCRIAKSIN